MKKFAKLFLAFSVLLLALECLLHLLPPPRYASNWIYDPVIGHHGPPNELVPLPGLGVVTQYNSFGYRGEDPTPRTVRPDEFSVVILGDSITEAVQVPWRRAYPKRLEYLLNTELKRDTEVTAFALSDYGTANELLVFERQAKLLQPDLVVLQFLGLNDFVNNGLAFAGRNKAMSDFSRPYLIPSASTGKVEEFFPLGPELKFTYLSPSWKRWREKSRLLNYWDFFSQRKVWTEKRAQAEIPSAEACASEVEVFLDEPDQKWRDSFEVTERLARALREAVEKLPVNPGTGLRPQLLAFYAPSYFEVFEPAWKLGPQLNLSRCFPGAFHRENAERHFLEIFAKAGVKAVSLREDFQKSLWPPQKLYLPDGHFSSEGHALAATALARHIVSLSRASTRQR